MNLHLDKEAFHELITATSNELAIDSVIVEKDYYVSVILQQLNNSIDGLVFRGGTSLSKCHKVIRRFSEDIDLTLLYEEGKASDSQKKRLKNAVLASLTQMNAVLQNLGDIRSRMEYNRYEASYVNISGETGRMLVETQLGMAPYPYEHAQVSNFIEEYLASEKRDDLIEKYALAPFKMKVQGLNRTFVDKVFAICDYYLDRVDKGQSRHLYDLYMLDQHVLLDDSLRTLTERVREDRRLSSSHRPSAQENVRINDILFDLVESDFFMKDYNDTTLLLLFEPMPYETVITQVQKIIDSNCFAKT